MGSRKDERGRRKEGEKDKKHKKHRKSHKHKSHKSSRRSSSSSDARSRSRSPKRQRAASPRSQALREFSPDPWSLNAPRPSVDELRSLMTQRSAARPQSGVSGGTSHGLKFWKTVFRCAACRVDSSGEVAFLSHINGKAHQKRAGLRGYAGVIPNDAGIIPDFSNPEMLVAHAAWCGQNNIDSCNNIPSGPWLPPVRRVKACPGAEVALRSALVATAHLRAGENVDQVAQASAFEAKPGTSTNGAGLHEAQRRQREMPPVPRQLRDGGPHWRTRERLPVFKHRREVLEALARPVSVVEGATGSGKTTQVAQFLLEEAAATGRAVKIICTQPRRISAIGVAERVAAERGEALGCTGNCVGYAVRGESRQSRDTALLFCTTGVLLRMLEENADLDGVTHVLVDEVHERTVENDFLLLALKALLQHQHRALALRTHASTEGAAEGGGRGWEGLHVCLMSATMESKVLMDYFAAGGEVEEGEGGGSWLAPVPRVIVEGRTFPVEELYLEEAIAMTGHYEVDAHAQWCRYSQAAQRRAARIEALLRDEGQGEGSARWRERREEALPSEGELLERLTRAEVEVCRSIAKLDLSVVNVDLVCALIRWFQRCGGVAGAMRLLRDRQPRRGCPGADKVEEAGKEGEGEGEGEAEGVLVFLPGVAEIDEVQQALARGQGGGGGVGLGGGEEDRICVTALHGSLPAEEQRRVFERPPRGVLKVVLATNVAETSVTIDDIAFVIDSGRVKEERYDAARRMSALEDVLVSRAAAKQRRGRAGRVRRGICVHLYPSDTRQATYTMPEVQRVALEQLVMRGKALALPGCANARAADMCARLPQPPEALAVEAAVKELASLGALCVRSEELTSLGRVLLKLPVDARLGKLLLLGVCFRATDECLTIAAALATSRSPFLSPIDRREEADEARRALGGADQSDLLCLLSAYKRFHAFEDEGSRYAFAREHFLSVTRLQGIAQLKRQLAEALSAAGLLPRGMHAADLERLARRSFAHDGIRFALRQEEEAEKELVVALLCAALFPQVAYLSAPHTKKGPCNADMVRLHVREAEGRSAEPQVAAVHPSSINSRLHGGAWRSCYVVFHERVQTSKVYIRDTTPAPPLALLLLCGARLEQKQQQKHTETAAPGGGGAGGGGLLVLDEWLRVEVSSASMARMLVEMRQRLGRLLHLLVNKAGGQEQGGAARGDLSHEVAARPLVEALVELVRMEVEPELQRRQRLQTSSHLVAQEVQEGAGKKRKRAGASRRSNNKRTNSRFAPPLAGGGAVDLHASSFGDW